MTTTAVRCWCCGAELVARCWPGLVMLECLTCGAGSTLPPPIVDAPVRCRQCGKLIVESAARPWRFRCPRSDCRTVNLSPT